MASLDYLEQLYDEHAQALFGYLLNLTRSEPDTHDVMQEVFCKLAAKPQLMAGLKEPRSFLLRLAHNQAVDLMRRRGTRERICEQLERESVSFFSESVDPDAAVFRNELSQALAELPEEQRTVVHLKLWEEMTFEAIAKVLNISNNTAASRYRYGLDKLRQRLRPFYQEVK